MHQFFQMHQPQPQQAQDSMTAELQNNLMVLEICNNWEFVLELYFKMVKGELNKVDNLQTSWISYINGNRLAMEHYKDANDFEEKHLRALSPEQIKE